MKRIIAYLQGGLGNQLFIYAAARSWALDTQADLVLDTGRFDDDAIYKRHLDLNVFTLSPLQYKASGFLARKFINRVSACNFECINRIFGIIREQRPYVWQRLPGCFTGTVRLDGYWQSEKYFAHNKRILLSELMLKESSWIERDDFASMIRRCSDSVFLHMRSYTDIPGMGDYSYALPLSYYQAALERLRDRMRNATVFVFSDDPGWARLQISKIAFRFPGYEFVYVDSGSQIRDFTLMRMCRHGIVANSSFSWWARWLGECEHVARGGGCISICPKGKGGKDFYPTRWISI